MKGPSTSPGFLSRLDLTVLLPIVTNQYQPAGGHPASSGTGFGDAMLLVKYRFFRRDSSRGTTQASVTVGPKLPTGLTDLTAANGVRLPAGVQPGSGSTDLFLAANWTYTGLFNIRRLVADEDFHSIVRSQGTQATRLGSEVESRFWLSYRPYEAKDGSREWFVGPVLTWQHFQDDRVANVTQTGSGGDAFLIGITTYFGVRPGMHLWLGADWDSAILAGQHSCPSVITLVLGLRSSFGCIVETKEIKMKRAFLMLVLLGSVIVVPAARAQIKHIEMRVEGMT
jgi:hypothetical protein